MASKEPILVQRQHLPNQNLALADRELVSRVVSDSYSGNMPFVLSDQKVCHPNVPLEWKTVLDDLSEFMGLEKRLRDDPKDEQIREQIGIAHDRLIAGSNDLLEPQALSDLKDRDVHRIFARSVLLMMRIASSVAGDDKVLDTANCRTLLLYEADFLADETNQEQLKKTLARTIGISPEELASIEASVERDIEGARRKHQLVRAIRDQFGLWDESERLREGMFRFFDALYPDVGIVDDEVELIVTGTMIFFCLPFTKDGLTTDRFQSLSPEEQKPTREFLKRVNRFSQWQFAHFPVFGFRRGEELEPALIQELAARCKLTADDVAKEISTLTAIIPIDEVDKYIVHDIYGHSWQACMLDFDDLYLKLSTFADPLELSEFAIEPSGADTVTFDDCFVGDGDSLHLDSECFRRFIDLEVAERLPIAMTPVLAEVLADVAEFKLHDKDARSMSTSSALASFPAKLDLTMRDVIYYFRNATKVFRLWATRDDRRQQTVAALIAKGATRYAAKRAVEDAACVWHELEGDWLSPELRFYEKDGLLHTNVVCRLALNFLAIHRETLNVYSRIGGMDLGNLPLKGLRDLMLISAAVFFEQAPSRNLWRVDEFLSLRIEPLCEAMVEESQRN